MILSVATNKIPYYVIAGGVYGVIGVVIVLAIVFGLRARVSAKWDINDRLPDGFSPLDIQRVLGGITYPRRITKALLYHWANMGYIKI
ncbi:MAG: hypothetical protein K2M95_06605, partial [Clostridiales bacterium]|nr:hypothetical protein [Clostridiales bacterium]